MAGRGGAAAARRRSIRPPSTLSPPVIASIESKTGKPASPAPDPAAAARVERWRNRSPHCAPTSRSPRAVRKTGRRCQCREIRAARCRAQRRILPPSTSASPGWSALRARQSTEIAQENAKPADDVALRRIVAAALLDVLVRHRRSLSRRADRGEIAGAESRCAEAARRLCRLGRAGRRRCSAANCWRWCQNCRRPRRRTSTTGSGLVDRLQAGAAKLVRIERTDAVGNERGNVVARVTAAALRNDYKEARRELETLPAADRAAAQGWLEKADARDAALAASRQFAAEAMSGARQAGFNRIPMYRIILFLLLIALAAAGAAWVADQSGEFVLSWDGWRVHTSLPVFALALGIVIVAAMLAWSTLARAVAHCRKRSAAARRERRHARGRHAITHGLLAIGHGDAAAARDARRRRAQTCRRTIRWRCCCTRNPPSSTATATGAQGRVPRHGRARGHAAVGPARTVHRGAARRRSGLRGR